MGNNSQPSKYSPLQHAWEHSSTRFTSSGPPIYVVVSLGVLFWFLRRAVKARRQLAGLGNLPGLRLLLDPTFPYPLPRIPKLCMDGEWFSKLRHQPFAEAGTDVISATSVLDSAGASLILCDPVAIKEVMRARLTFPKAIDHLKQLNVFGVNIVTAEGREYRKHRNPVQRSFTEKNNAMVWATATQVARDLFDSDLWSGNKIVACDDVDMLTISLTLKVITATAFGQRLDPPTQPASGMTFENALMMFSRYLITYVLVPRWILRLRAPWREIDDAFALVSGTAARLIEERKRDNPEDHADLLSALIRAADEEQDPRMRLSTGDLIVDAMVFLIAGHETAAHNLAFILGLLALYPEEQALLYQEVLAHSVNGNPPRYEDHTRLRRCSAFMKETLRLYPPLPQLLKRSGMDTTLPLGVPLTTGEKSIPVPAGTLISIHVHAVHYNPLYWEHPYAFRPSRFIDEENDAPWPRDAWMPFGAGARTCLGRRYAETEILALLSSLLMEYSVELDDACETRLKGLDGNSPESERKRREALFRQRQGLTLGQQGLTLKFRRR